MDVNIESGSASKLFVMSLVLLVGPPLEVKSLIQRNYTLLSNECELYSVRPYACIILHIEAQSVALGTRRKTHFYLFTLAA